MMCVVVESLLYRRCFCLRIDYEEILLSIGSWSNVLRLTVSQ